MSELFPPTLDDLIAEVEREIKQRHFVYPRRVAAKSMTPAKADRQIHLMEMVLTTLLELRAGGT